MMEQSSSAKLDTETFELTPILKPSSPVEAQGSEAWDRRDVWLLPGLVAIAVGIGSLSYHWQALLPAFEHDAKLGWNEDDTTMLASLAGIMETIGLALAGPCADYIPSLQGWLFICLAALTGALVESVTSSKTIIMLTVCFVLVCRGMQWTTLGTVIARNRHPSKHDLYGIACALGCRLADAMSSMVIGHFIDEGSTWRLALQKFMLISGTFMLLAAALIPKDLAPPGDREFSFTGIGRKLRLLLRNVNAWLTLGVLLGSYCIWSMAVYLGVLLVDLFGVSPGKGAKMASFIHAGSATGLVTGAVLTSLLGPRNGRIAQVAQVSTGIIWTLTLACFHLSLFNTVSMYALMGWSFVLAGYLPYVNFGASCPPDSKAFNLAVLDSTASSMSFGMTFAFGRLRASSLTASSVATIFYLVSAVGMSVTTICMSVLYYRLGRHPQSD